MSGVGGEGVSGPRRRPLEERDPIHSRPEALERISSWALTDPSAGRRLLLPQRRRPPPLGAVVKRLGWGCCGRFLVADQNVHLRPLYQLLRAVCNTVVAVPIFFMLDNFRHRD